jgi:uncharacterized membrane protein YkvA (DUF1232 family)
MAPGSETDVDAEVLESSVVDESLLLRLLRNAGRAVALPALECLEILLDPDTPNPAKFTVLAALTYLMMPLDLIPDFIPVVGFSDDLVAITALLGIVGRHRSEAVRLRARRRLDQWFPPTR